MQLVRKLFSSIIAISLFCIVSVFADDINNAPENMNQNNDSVNSNQDDVEEEEEEFNFILDEIEQEVEKEIIYTSSVKVNAGYSNADSFKYGEYNGVENEGTFPDAEVTIRLRDEYDGNSSNYFEFLAENPALDSRSLYAEYGEQGKYSISFLHEQIQHNIYDDALTPFIETEENNLILPDNWTGGIFTDEMTALKSSLYEIEIETHR